MPLVSTIQTPTGVDARQSDRAMMVRSGLIRGLAEKNWSFLPEFGLPNGRRADLVALDEKGKILIFEIKSSVEDFRVDMKWQEYKPCCDRFYFATLADVPAEIFPQAEGLVIADRYGCEILREAASKPLAPARRKALTLRYARAAADRLVRYTLHETALPG